MVLGLRAVVWPWDLHSYCNVRMHVLTYLVNLCNMKMKSVNIFNLRHSLYHREAVRVRRVGRRQCSYMYGDRETHDQA